VQTAFPGVPGLTVHRIVAHATISVGDVLRAEVATPLRDATRRNHTATHLLHASLRQVLGKHVKQAGSVVEPGRLRFDFTHYAAMDKAELDEVERLMNEEILKNTDVSTDVLPLEQAIATGAMALFGEKYGDEVRVVTVPPRIVRRHSRAAYRRYRFVQGRLRGQYLRGRKAHRSDHWGGRAAPVPGTDKRCKTDS
jgi:alanyl-tRNA synthetase